MLFAYACYRNKTTDAWLMQEINKWLEANVLKYKALGKL